LGTARIAKGVAHAICSPECKYELRGAAIDTEIATHVVEISFGLDCFFAWLHILIPGGLQKVIEPIHQN
jgi:hypothetical protein